MNRSNEKKIAVLNVLREASCPMGIHAVLEHLPKNFAQRSVRRWLSDFVHAGLVEKIGQKRATLYLYSAIPTRLQEANVCFGDSSHRVIAKIRRPLFERTPVPYNDKFLEEYTPNQSFYLPLQVRAELINAGKRARAADPAGSYARRIFNRLLIDLSYNSSRLEGNTYSLLETEKLVLEGKGAKEKSEEEKVMILNHKEAIRYLVDSAPKLQVSRETICTLHFLLSDALVEPCYSGHVRDHEVRIGGSTYVPYADPKKLLKLLDVITKKAALIQDPYEQSFFLLIHLSYLQAFSDVNKRTSRLTSNIPLIKNNLVPLSFNDISREDYTSAIIAIYELQNIQPMIELYLFSYKRGCALYDTTIQSIGVDVLRARYRQQRRELLASIILQKKTGPSMEQYIRTRTKKMIPTKDQLSFIEDVREDLQEIDPSRIYGLGVTVEEFLAWKKHHF